MVKVTVYYIDRDIDLNCRDREVDEETVTTIGELKAYLAPEFSVPVGELLLYACHTLLLDDGKSLDDVPISDRAGSNVSTDNFYCDLSVSSNILINDLKVKIWEAKNQLLDLHPERQELIIHNNVMMEDDLALRE
ncbi:hypothetical protein FRX31_019018 [Thalictrum thalictroides]|uniref:Ubiquitin-like domain-containing protein n=1 Tax=Thalictrum thalictroides TaxID=46969 RepID=A0A7J6W4Y8_THATH|nr:hypothetical protein FRX31_019018 [Thalictrum thalictroides]